LATAGWPYFFQTLEKPAAAEALAGKQKSRSGRGGFFHSKPLNPVQAIPASKTWR